MIEIIKRGTKKKTNCKNCGCAFSYEDEDIQCEFREKPTSAVNTGRHECVKCPQCGEFVFLKATR